MPNRLLAALAGLFALVCFASPAQAYWEYGHESVARIAWLQMRPDTRAKVAALLRQGRLLETPECPVATIEQARVWALIPAVSENVTEGGIRLARLLDDVLCPEAKAPGQKR
jgi:hypothetical protein